MVEWPISSWTDRISTPAMTARLEGMPESVPGCPLKRIPVNAVTPGPIWTPLIPSTFSKKQAKSFGSKIPMKRAGQPEEVTPSELFPTSSESLYMTGQVLPSYWVAPWSMGEFDKLGKFPGQKLTRLA